MEGQPIEFISDTGSPTYIIPPIINPKELKKATKCFVDVNKNPIKFKSEALVEAKTEKSRVVLPMLITEKKHTTIALIGLARKTGNGLQGYMNTNITQKISTDERRETTQRVRGFVQL